MRFVWEFAVCRFACPLLAAPVPLAHVALLSAGLSVLPHPAVAGNCTGAGAPYTIGAQNDTVELDADCAAAGGAVTITGNVVGDGAGSGQAVIHDQPGNEQDWSVTINNGVTVQDIVNITAGLRFESANGSVDNSGTVNVTRNPVLFQGVAGSVTNRSGGILNSTAGGGVSLLSGGTVNNAGTISAGGNSTGIVLRDSGTIDNSGSITGRRGVFFGTAVPDGNTDNAVLTNASTGTITATNAASDGILITVSDPTVFTITNHGTITGGSATAGIRANSFSQTTGTIINSGTINGGTNGAIVFNSLAASNDILELQPGFTINGNVHANGGTDTLRFAGTGDGTFDLDTIDSGANTRQYRSFETFLINSGTWTFSGASSEQFVVNGGNVKGTGTFGGLTLQNGATLAPGNSIGTVNTGSLTLNAGSTLLIEVSNSAADKVVVTGGTVTINGATLILTPDAGVTLDVSKGPTFTIIDNQGAGAVQGAGFATVNNQTPFTAVAVTATGGDGNDVVITFTPTVMAAAGASGTTTFSGTAETRNQRSVAGALDNSFFVGGAANSDETEVMNALLLLSANGSRTAYDLLSGEIHAAASDAHLAVGRDFTNTLVDRGTSMRSGANGPHLGYAALGNNAEDVAAMGRLVKKQSKSATGTSGAGRQTVGNRFNTWAGGFGRTSRIDSSANAAGQSESVWGLAGGADFAVATGTRVGFAAGYTSLHNDIGARLSSAAIDAANAALYAAFQRGDFHAFGAASYGYGFIDTERTITFGGLTRRAGAGYGAHQGSFYSEIGYTLGLDRAWLQPIAAARVSHSRRDSFRETGAGSLTLGAGSKDETRFETTLGARLAASFELGGVTLVPQVKALYTHSFGSIRSDADFTLAGGGTTNIVSTGRGRDAFTLGVGASLVASDTVTSFIDYQARFSENTFDNSIRGGLKIAF